MKKQRIQTERDGDISIPLRVWDDTNLSLSARACLQEIMHLKPDVKRLYVSNSFLGEILGVSNGRVSQLIKELKELNYIKVHEVTRENSNQVIKRSIQPNYDKIFGNGLPI